LEAALEFAGASAVGGGWFGGEESFEQVSDFERPVRVMVAAGRMGSPEVGLALGAGAQVVGAQIVEMAQMDVQFAGGGLGREALSAYFGEQVTD
jgi:hypothetical protein